MTSTYRIKHLPLLSIEEAQGKAKASLVKAKHQLGFVPNMYGAMANEPALFEAYASGIRGFPAGMRIFAGRARSHLSRHQPREQLRLLRGRT